MSTMITSERTFQEAATYGGVVDAIGGAATVILAIVALAGVGQSMLAAIATIVFGAALLIQGGTMLTEFTKLIAPPSAAGTADEVMAGGGLSSLFVVGAAGIVLGVLALVGIAAQTLTAAAVIAFGGALLLSSNSVWRLYRAKRASYRAGEAGTPSGAEFLAGEMASGSAALQCLSGLAAIVLGILAVTGTNASVLTLVGLLVLGATVLLTGSTLSGTVMGFMEPTVTGRGEALAQQPGAAE
ncbi:hypothetical protein MTX26_07335 [Bradyrhizobium sp. ISRA443]|uniref:hypothetical protein n=1 Tax=unclassified Bradyrhizobium TaxID=2631580 RepID=UPI002478CFE7|nr:MULTISPECIES: hypothetical protein [unclassified Bradyrhizobium]WGR95580.1 hypothetical protein MTX20_17585 [Bradyrhizobium sp. ISRA435]WGS00638.1 hypothetical protein MTX23_07330 [Bradyrhizobium sp. ISRA436]WGS07526.1 hypothetical protein MTX18_07330 [Bradyrhizobium sp. ISRA437]WGS14413.1 hypothetical protein MTX26_07335 [Bradyrhizobium sp. ISRA443]